ncbi:outer membrane beta-barrel protein [Deltaproteobacteria bacterium IMCC39524]|nr:outer membrane beta-barrel protein [Deltaproteobacteria bacterium IMCC39524]
MKSMKYVVVILFLSCSIWLSASDAEAVRTYGESVLIDVDNKGRETENPKALYADDIFGSQRGNWHPSLSLTGYWTDNLFETSTDEEEDFVTVVSPGLWLAFPARFDRPASVPVVTRAPGGLAYSLLDDTAEYGLFQVYAAYSANIERYKDFSDEDETTHNAEGKLGFYPGPKTRIELQHVFDENREDFSTGGGARDQEDKYTGNLTNLSVGYQLTHRLSLGVSGSYYDLDYNDKVNAAREREDTTFGGKVAFALTEKLDIFVEYVHVDIDYKSFNSNDSEENQAYAGLAWSVTEKTRGMAKIGYNKKDYDSQTPDEDELQVELQLGYRFSPKTDLTLRGLRKLNETDIVGTSGRLTHAVSGSVAYALTPKVSTSLNLGWQRDEYLENNAGPDRDDDYYNVGAAVSWQAQRWLTATCGYDLVDRDSNVNTYDYTTNTAYLSLSAAL